MSTISAGTTTTTALVSTGDTTGNLVLATGSVPTTALTLNSTTQAATFAGAVTAPSVTSTGTVNALNTFGFKNRIINGGMTIDQRNAGASVTITNTGAGTYTLDRWVVYGSQASKFSVQQNAGSVTPPTGYINYLGTTSLSAYSVASGDEFTVNQIIEGLNVADLGWGTANAKTVTLSAWVYSSLTGTFGGSLRNSAANRSYPFTYTISSANTWTQISVTIAGDTTGTWLTTNGAGIRLAFSLGTGTTQSGTAGAWAATNYTSATGATSVVGTNGATFYLTGVQLEVGSQATSFDFRSIGQEFLLCQRYFSQTAPYGSLPTAAGINGYRGAIAYATDQATGGFYFPCEMRTAPTVTPYSSNGTSGVWTKPGNVNSGATSANNIGTNGFMYFIGSSYTVSTILYGSWTASAEL